MQEEAGRWTMQKGSQSIGIVEVTRDNWHRVRPAVLSAISQASFVAVDTEFSGLGDDKKGRLAKDMEERYQSIIKVVKTHSLLQFGLSVFRRTYTSAPLNTQPVTQSATPPPPVITYDVQTFNFGLLADEEFQVTPSSMRFLAESGLDFNFLFAKGIRFEPKGTEKPPQPSTPATPMKKKKGERDAATSAVEEKADVASIVAKLIECKTSIILHNGFLDLLYIYHNFVGPLPQSFASFTNKLCATFPRVYDTKYIADFHTKETASYLEYLYHKCERNSPNSSLHIINPTVCTVVIAPEIWNHTLAPDVPKQTCCIQYARHGYCPDGARCSQSHDIDKILDLEDKPKKSKKRKRKQTKNSLNEQERAKIQKLDEENITQEKEEKEKEKEKEVELNGDAKSGIQPDEGKEKEKEKEKEDDGQELPKIKNKLPPDVHIGKMHSAGFDSFATGYIYGHFLLRFGAKEMYSFSNNIYLVGKDFPLRLQKSLYA